jgi:hypothetical protein
MTELWYKNPKILLDNMNQFFPSKTLNRIEKINSLARFAIYYFILVNIFCDDKSWGSISIIILLISMYLGSTENFTLDNATPVEVDFRNELDVRICQNPTIDNPFMNYTVGDMITSPDRPPACKYDDAKKEMEIDFRSKLYSDPNDMWGRNISSRQFYTMPNTAIVNDQVGFGKACFGTSGDCKTFGQNCLEVNDIMYHTMRLQSVD